MAGHIDVIEKESRKRGREREPMRSEALLATLRRLKQRGHSCKSVHDNSIFIPTQKVKTQLL